MSDIIEGVYHDGTIKLLQKVLIQENKRLKLVIVEDEKENTNDLINLPTARANMDLIKSAELYSEIYNSNPELQDLTNSYCSEWPE
jgi:predicted DNA-binding antitoxin AbrB/MazE fold protein